MKLQSVNQNDILLMNDYNQFLFDNKKYKLAQEKINIQITNNLYNKQTYFLKGRLHLTLNELELAEQSFIKSNCNRQERCTIYECIRICLFCE